MDEQFDSHDEKGSLSSQNLFVEGARKTTHNSSPNYSY
jgi:hypothetical protein